MPVPFPICDRRFLLFCALFLSQTLTTFAADLPLTPIQAGVHDAELHDLGNGEWEVRTTGTDPYFFVRTDGTPIDLKTQPTFSFEYFSTTGIGRMLVFVGSVLDIPHLLVVADLGRREGWSPQAVDLTATAQPVAAPLTSLRITLGERAGIVVRLRALCARAPTEQEARLATDRVQRIENDRQHAARLTAYLQQQFPCTVTSVTVDAGEIRVEGDLGGSKEKVSLAEVPMWADITALTSPPQLLPITPDERGHFAFHVPREPVQDREPLLSAWAIVRKSASGWEPLSALHYVDEQKPRAPLAPAHPRSLKGLGGCPFDSPDMEELGIASVTLNIVLNDIIASEPGPGRTPFHYLGRTWYAQDGVVAGYDRHMKLAAEHGWMVSAIILLTPVRQAPPGAWIRDAAHPDADSTGLYVMPNFTSQAGVNAFAAAMNFLAERYSRPDGQYGRVHHWIMHNEVNSGFYWTNAGTKTLITYLDLYQKSLRVACLLARQYDPNAKPLISLEHDWTVHPDPRSYAGREMLDRLVDFSRKEGDFPWGIAFHPYAQDLFNPRTWEDAEATFNFATPYITFRNIEVLDAWALQPRVAYRGREPREIQFTEQGLNSRDYSEKALTDQAAGLAYAWKKIESLKTVTAFQYHLWADDRSEGGLRLGLRKFADDPQDPLGRKPSWQIYKAIGTDGWEEAARFALPIIGIKDWDAVRHTDKIREN